MSTVKSLLRTGLLASLMLLPLQVLAHTGLKTSSPADGATVQMAPENIELVFTADVRLIKMEITSNGQAVKTDFKPSATSAANFVVATPGLTDGSYTVNWAVIGADGHTVTNSFGFTVDASAAHGAHGAHGESHEHAEGHEHSAAHAENHGHEEAHSH